MRILAFSWRDPKHPLAGGAEQVIHEYAKGWVKAGHEVTFFSSLLRGMPRSETLDNIKIIRGGYQYFGVQMAGFLHYLMNRHKYDLVIDQFHGFPFFTPLFVKKPKIALIHETTGKLWFLNPLFWPFNWIISIIGYFSEPIIFKLYKNIPFMTISKSTKDDLVNFGIPEKNIKVIHNGVTSKNITRTNKEKVHTILYLGILSKDKGIEDAIKCFALLSQKGRFQFWVVGRTEPEWYFNNIKKLVDKLKLSSKVKFWGYVNDNTKFKLLSKAHILINPSIKEGWGLVNIEANTMYTPVVAYCSLGLRDSVKTNINGYLCLKNTPENLAEHVLKLLDNKKIYADIQNKAYLWSKRYNWQKSTNQSLKFLIKIANGN